MTTNLELAEPTTAPTGPCMCCDDSCPHYDECCGNESSVSAYYELGDEREYVPICTACNEYEQPHFDEDDEAYDAWREQWLAQLHESGKNARTWNGIPEGVLRVQVDDGAGAHKFVDAYDFDPDAFDSSDERET